MKRLTKILDRLMLDKETRNLQKINLIREKYNELQREIKDERSVQEKGKRIAKIMLLRDNMQHIRTKEHREKVKMFMDVTTPDMILYMRIASRKQIEQTSMKMCQSGWK